ncbi:DNA-directed RNA polymerase subunit E'' [Candidatus Woesearchaeota archaeon]|nr:DNA-directed RNA polymerase subunit E'' [Candidatus Woesearchaeota archaeon]
MKKRICKSCKLFVEESECPLCKGNQFNTSWQGRINVLDHEKSVVSRKMGLRAAGEYALKSR